MQIVRTEVVNGTSGNGMPATRVTFRGEGGSPSSLKRVAKRAATMRLLKALEPRSSRQRCLGNRFRTLLPDGNKAAGSVLAISKGYPSNARALQAKPRRNAESFASADSWTRADADR
jgi:hypothetical protein